MRRAASDSRRATAFASIVGLFKTRVAMSAFKSPKSRLRFVGGRPVRPLLRWVMHAVDGASLAMITWLAARKLPGTTARIVKLKVQTVYRSPTGRVRRRVLLLTKQGFLDDALTTLSKIDSMKVHTLKRPTLKAIAAAFLPPEVSDYNYSSADAVARAAMVRYREFLVGFWREFDPHRRIDAVMTGNFGYYAEREFAAALEELGVPFIVLQKENS